MEATCLSAQGNQRLPRHHRIFIVDQERSDSPGLVGPNLVEGFHHFDKADHIASHNLVTDFLKLRFFG